MELWDFFLELPEFFSKYSRRWYSYILPFVISIYFINSIYGKIIFTCEFLKLDLSIVLSLFSFIIWTFIFYFNRKKLKNTSNLPGIGIFLEDSLSYSNSISRKRFIKDMKKIFYNKFCIKIYDEGDYKKYVDGGSLKEKVFESNNLFCAILLSDEEGTEDGEEVYILNVNAAFLSRNVIFYDFYIYSDNFKLDLKSVLPTSFKINQKNNIVESSNVSKRIYASINYLYAINLIVSTEPSIALGYLKNVEDIIDELDQSSYSVIYMKEKLLNRKLEVKLNCLDLLLDSDFDMFDETSNKYCLAIIDGAFEDVNKLMERGYENIENVYKNLLMEKIRALFDLGFYDNVIAIIDSEGLLVTHHSLAFIIRLLSMSYSDNFSNEQVFSYFKSNRKKFNGKEKEYMLKFVQKRYEYYENDYNLLFIFFLLNKYFKDRILANKLYELLLDDENKRFYDILRKFS